MKYHRYASPLGDISIYSDGGNIIGLYFSEQTPNHDMKDEGSLPVFVQADEWLDTYFKGKAPDFTPPLKISGSEFQRSVSDVMMSIPFGHVMTYSDIAGIIAKRRGISRMSAQAVGGGAARNTISLIIPCHRVVGANGNLTGYGGGLDRKAKLLELEGVDVSKFFIPMKSKHTFSIMTHDIPGSLSRN